MDGKIDKKLPTPWDVNFQAGFFYPEIYLLCNFITNNTIILYFTKIYAQSIVLIKMKKST